MEKLIFKYLRNELSDHETNDLKNWLESDDVNRKIFENIVGEWNLNSTDIEESKAKILASIHQKGTSHVIQGKKKSSQVISVLLRIAAVLVLITGLSMLVISAMDSIGHSPDVSNTVYIEKEAENGQKLTFDLPDGSIVKLNSGSKLIFPKEFDKDNRKVTLVGEAYFDIQRDVSRPFEIISDQLYVKVLGTSFNVKAYPNDVEKNVAVKSGKVEVRTLSNSHTAILNKSEMAVFNQQNKSFSSLPVADSVAVFGWTEQQLIFQNQQIGEIFKVMKRWFNVSIEERKSIHSSKEFTGKYKNPSLKEVMESLSYTFEFKYEIYDNRVIIK